MKTTRTALLMLAVTTHAACGILDPHDRNGGSEISVTLLGLPDTDTLRQTGLEFAFESSGSTPYASVAVVVDPGTPAERSFSIDSAWRAEAPPRFPVVVTGPISNGEHVFELRVVDAEGRAAKAQFTRVTHVPDVPYTLQFPGAGFDDSGAAGITSSGKIAGTVYTGVSPSQTSQMVLWENGVRTQPRGQGSVLNSRAMGINSHGEIVGEANVSGTGAAVFWRADSLEVLSIDNQPVTYARGIDNSHRALVFTSGFKVYFKDVHDGSATPLSISLADMRMNGLGQIVSVSPQLYGTSINVHGGLTIRLPAMRPGRHERLFRGTTWGILGINDRGEFLGTREHDAFLSQTDTVEYIDFRLPSPKQIGPRPGYLLAASGDVVSIRGADSLYVWSPNEGTRRMAFGNSGWTIDGLYAMNENRQLIAHGVNNQTGEKGALLLSPAAASATRK